MKQRREATQRAIEKRKKENKERRDKIGGSARAYYKNNPGGNTGNKSDKKESSLNSRTHVMYKGKKVLKTSAMGKKAVAAQKREALGKKNYMSKEMIEKRKKRLKIKK
jgi:hypothetical protein